MKNSIVSQIGEHLSAYLQGDESLRDFRDWFAPVSWNIEDCVDPKAVDVSYEIDGILAESSSAGWPESQLKQELATAVLPSLVSPEPFIAA